MNIIVRYQGPRSRQDWQELAETKLRKLQTLAVVETARVAIQWQRRVGRACRVVALLEVAGPDLHAEACDYTLQAALAKVVKSLERQIRSRKHRRVDQWKTNLQLGLNPNHRSPGLVSARR
jgi:ribosome-associated translation inhibitor RaiA